MNCSHSTLPHIVFPDCNGTRSLSWQVLPRLHHLLHHSKNPTDPNPSFLLITSPGQHLTYQERYSPHKSDCAPRFRTWKPQPCFHHHLQDMPLLSVFPMPAPRHEYQNKCQSLFHISQSFRYPLPYRYDRSLQSWFPSALSGCGHPRQAYDFLLEPFRMPYDLPPTDHSRWNNCNIRLSLLLLRMPLPESVPCCWRNHNNSSHQTPFSDSSFPLHPSQIQPARSRTSPYTP